MSKSIVSVKFEVPGHVALVRAQELDAGKVQSKTQAEVFQKARAVLG